MKTLKNYSIYALLLFCFGCHVSPQSIDYGQDACHFCQMTIVDKVHAAEIVTKKAKVYKFDATECMINFTKDIDVAEIGLFLSNDYTEPEVLIDATQATFLISENVPSPMGAYLSAFKSKDDALKTLSEKGGQLFSWQELLIQLKN